MKIIFEDDFLIVIDKPAGIVVNRSESAKQATVQEWAEDKLGIDKFVAETEIEKEFASRGGVVHRLDKETSGLLVIAKNAVSFEKLKNQFKSRIAEKTYLALAHGKITPKTGEIDVPIGRLPWNRMRFGIMPDGRAAKTLYKVLGYRVLKHENYEEELSLVELYPKTGRTHQIRVHLRHIGNPIFADMLYAGRKNAKRDRKLLPRHFLHASKLLIKHPVSGEDLSIESELPDELREFLEKTQNPEG